MNFVTIWDKAAFPTIISPTQEICQRIRCRSLLFCYRAIHSRSVIISDANSRGKTESSTRNLESISGSGEGTKLSSYPFLSSLSPRDL